MRAEIFLLQSTSEFDELYTYNVPEEIENEIREGSFVLVPFGRSNRAVEGVVRSLKNDGNDAEKGTFRIKDILSVDKDHYPLSENSLKLCENIQREYLCTRGAAARLMIPPAVNEKEKQVRIVSLAVGRDKALETADGNELRNIVHIRTLKLLAEYGSMPVNELVGMVDAKSESFIKTLEKKSLVRVSKENRDDKCEKADDAEIKYEKHELNEEQQRAYDKINSLVESKEFHEVLLFGVTSGGKTEVYLRLVENVIANGGRAVVLVPEISLTPQMTVRFTGRFGKRVAVVHSRLSEGEKKREWLRMKNGEADIVIGARSAVFAPFENVSLYIIDEEQEWTYKSEETPRYHASEVAVMRAKNENATVVYGSATPSVNTFYRARKGLIDMAEISHRATKHGLPSVRTVDMREAVRNGEPGIFSSELYGEMKKNVENGEQTVIFVQRRGYSKDLLCESCGKTMICGKCSVSMTVHEREDRLICHYCGNTVKIPRKCPGCGSGSMRRIGVGTERVEEELKILFPGCSVVRMDTDTTSRKNGHEEALRKFGSEKADFLVGTQMIAKGHDFPGVTLVGVVSADSILNIREYTAAEKAFQLITQVCGRAGRGDNPGRVVIQAYDLDSYAITAAIKQDYVSFYNTEITIRNTLCYPPYCAMGTLIFSSENDRQTFDRADAAFDILWESAKKNGIISSDILGPARCPVPKIKDRYRWRLTVKTKDRESLLTLLREFNKEYGRKFGHSSNDQISCCTEV